MLVVTLPMSAAGPASGEDPGIPALPIVAAASLIKREGSSGYYSVHFGLRHEHWAMLYQNPGLPPGLFVVTEIEGPVAGELPPGQPWDAWVRTPAARDWQHWRITGDLDGEAVVDTVVRFTTAVPMNDATPSARWNHEVATNVTSSRPTLPSTCGKTAPADILAQVEISRGR